MAIHEGPTRGLESEVRVQEKGAFKRRFGRRIHRRNAVSALVAGLLLGCCLVLGAGPVGATNREQVTVLSPVTGTVSSTPDEVPPHHRYYGELAFDTAQVGGGTAYFRVRNASGTVTASISVDPKPSCEGGRRAIISVKVDGQHVGNVHYSHLKSVVRSGPIAPGAPIGQLTSDATKSESCWTGPHAHVELQNAANKACFFRGLWNKAANSSTALGILGGAYATGSNSACPANAEANKPALTASSPPAAAKTGSSYSYQFKASGSPAPTFSRGSGSFPPGLSLSSSGLLSGKPTVPGKYTFTVKATNTSGVVATATKTVTVGQAPAFTAANPNAGTVGVVYSYQFAANGHPSPTFSLASGSLPPGLMLSNNGLLSGTPTAAGAYSFAVKSSNSAGAATTATLTVAVIPKSPSAPYIGPEDIDGDGCVGLTDLNLVIANWGQPGGPADVNRDGMVNIVDYNAIIVKWGQGSC